MTSTMIPPGQAQGTEPVFEDAGSSGGSRKTLLIVGGALAAVAAAAAAWFFLFSGGSGEEASSAPLPKGKPAASAPAKPAPSAAVSTPVKAAPIVGRDPFAPLGSSAAASAPKPAAAAAPVVQAQTTTSTLVLTAVDQAKGTATVAVDGKSYQATVGKPFASYYSMYAVFNDSCAGFLVGDASVPVCIGHSASVTH